MPRTLRFEEEGAVYHVLNRGNYRADIFGSEGARTAFLKCLEEACAKTNWVVHAWCLMSNHYHLALETPVANLVEGMQWLQVTFALRFNRLRQEHGHLFQGRYKSLLVDPDAGLGPLCHYIHLNPVRASLCAVEALAEWPWTSLRWLVQPRQRPRWYTAKEFLHHAGGLADTPAGRKKYLEYLAWVAEDEPARKAMQFDRMSQGWIVGSTDFKVAMALEQRRVAAALAQGDRDAQQAGEVLQQKLLDQLLKKARRTRSDLHQSAKMADWKVALAAAMKARTTVTNRWLAEQLHMGSLHEVSRRVAAFQCKTTNYKT
jgi:REP element-mobilizing transposase RayT